jgi:hypothetical protein
VLLVAARHRAGGSRSPAGASSRSRSTSEETMKIRFVVIALLGVSAGLVFVTLAQDDVDDRIADAMSAAPEAIARDATVWAYPDGPEVTVLREGTNGWLCVSSSPTAVAAGLQDPNCMDEVWQGFLEAFMAGETPEIDRIGISYMLAGDAGAGNVDPYATGPEDDPTWHASGPHIMILMPDHDYTGVPTDHAYGGPYVMWADTPYAHIMIPVADHEDHP